MSDLGPKKRPVETRRFGKFIEGLSVDLLNWKEDFGSCG